MKKVYIVMKSTGQYEDRFESPQKAFTSKEKADAYVESKNNYFDKLQERYDEIDYDVDENIGKLFNEYLKDTDKNFYDASVESDKSYDAYKKKNGNYDGFHDTFDWDRYYDLRSDFEENVELVNKYIDKCSLTEKEKEDFSVYREYHEQERDGLPHFYVSHRELELIEE